MATVGLGAVAALGTVGTLAVTYGPGGTAPALGGFAFGFVVGCVVAKKSSRRR
jgi:hypothetical protein